MLVLTRRVGQRVQIGQATVVILKIQHWHGAKNPQVRLGIEAPPHVCVLRDDAKDESEKHTLKAHDVQG